MPPLPSPFFRPLAPISTAFTSLRNSLFTPPQTTIEGVSDQLWPSPLQPVQPFQPVGGEPLRYPLNWGQNLIFTQRTDARYSTDQLRDLARYVIARICIDNTKDILAKMPWRVQPKAQPNENRKDRAKRAAKDPNIGKLTKFFERPNPQQDWPTFIRPVLDDLLVIDAPAIYVERNKKDFSVAGLRWVEGGSITVLIEQHGWTPPPPSPAYQQTWQGYPRIELTTDQLVYRPNNICPLGIDGSNQASFLYGLSPVEAIAKEIEIGIARLQFVYDFYAQGTVPGAILFAPVNTAASKIKEAQDYIDSDLAGNLAKRRRIQIFQGFQEAGKTEQTWQPKEPILADVFDELHIRKICFAFGTSPMRLMRMMNRGCHSEDTETLTDRGWLTYDKVSDDDLVAQFNPDKKTIEFVKPSALNVYFHKGDMISFKNKYVDVLVTPEHDMWTRFYNSNKDVVYKKKTNRKSSKRTWGLVDWNYHKIKAGELNRSSYFVASASFCGEERESFTIPGVRTTKSKLSTREISEIQVDARKTTQDRLAVMYKVDQSTISAALKTELVPDKILPSDSVTLPMDDWLEFLGYYISEGRRSHERTCYEVGVSQKVTSPFSSKIEECFDRLPFEYKRHLNPEDLTNTYEWRINSGVLHSYLKENIGGYCYEKNIPREYLSLSKRQLRILFDALMRGDGSWGQGSKGGRKRLLDMRASTYGSYATTSKKLADDVQELAIRLGYSAFITPTPKSGNDPNRRDSYSVNINCTHSEHFFTPKNDKTSTHYEGFVYCFTVPSGLFVTRRNGYVAIQGNSATTIQEASEEEGTLPWMDWTRRTMNHIVQILMKMPNYEFAFDPFIENDVKKLAEADEIDIKDGLYTRNEKREARGDDPINSPEADELTVVTSTGVIPLRMAEDIANAEIQSRKAKSPIQSTSTTKVEKTNGHDSQFGCLKHRDSYPRIGCAGCVYEEKQRLGKILQQENEVSQVY